MLDNSARERLLDRLGLPAAGRRFALDAAKYAPIRQVASRGGGNVVTPYQSRKMQRTIETESRHLEFPAAVGHEHDPRVLEYFPQPCRLKFEFVDADGEIHAIDHTPDFLVITERELWLEEWKPWSKLERLARRLPWRYQLDASDRWRSDGIEQWLAERGIGYRILSDRDIPQLRVENTLFLEDYLDPAAPPCPLEVELRLKAALQEEATLYLAEIYERLDCRPDDLFKLVADGLIVTEPDHALLSQPTRCRVFRDTAVRDFEHARHRPAPFAPPGTLDITEGTRLTYDGQPYTVTLVGGNKVVLHSDDHKSVEVHLKTLEALALEQDVRMIQPPAPGSAIRLSDFTENELGIALARHRALESVSTPNRTQRRQLKALSIAKLAGTDELVALIPALRHRGNRTPRLSTEQEAAMDEIIRREFESNRAPNLKHCHRQLRILCAERAIQLPSYPTFISRVRARPQPQQDRARHGNRVAYQNAEFVHVLYADTPVHGCRAFQYVHMDHTELDLELVSLRTGKSLGRPWLSIAIDAYTRRIVSLYLSYDPPSYRSNMMLLRDMVRRYRRLPQFIVVDNGADFRCADFERFTELMRIHVRYRPAGRPRHGSVMERIFGRLHTEYIHNLAGNTKALKEVRRTTGKFLPSRLAEWSLGYLYYGIEYWAFTYYDNAPHSALGVSPCEAFDRSIASAGGRAHRIVTLTQDFLVLSCPTVGRVGTRKVDRQRGIKVHNHFLYWCPEFRDPTLHGRKLPVRYDPWDSATVYVQIDKRWVPAHCKALIALGQLTDKERELVSTEMRSCYRLREDAELSTQQLAEFLRVFTPKGAAELALERQHENRELYRAVGIGAIASPSQFAALPAPTQALDLPKPQRVAPPALAPTAALQPLDLPDFDTF
ncbi:DDE-type integrase/transposase/recombinase [Aromatoleum toluolicum]|uniref:DDE-type integrase/transposase/recombinase n=1 Tax=Aromatoleum toluolicum TaxID=90060 RepID=A0ABX1NK33_9RHOO|nr:Mu transposase C-terminal domain-containing protein [Aromatoleum toluolicum]NMF99686.1 DDE-type integrase/transposase/recombinase [Aromatoleum toluolicum]